MKPVKRDMKFSFDQELLNNWHSEGRHVAHLLNSLSTLFPDGELFFIKSVRYFRDNGYVQSPELLADIKEFIGQEAMHGREHRKYNELLDKLGLAATQKSKINRWILDTITKRTSRQFHLAVTCSLEHLTASLADILLRYDEGLQTTSNSDATLRAAWSWHAMEEIEHKGVAYDVFQTAVGDDTSWKAYMTRLSGHALVNLLLWPMMFSFWVDTVVRAKDAGDLKGWWRSAKWMFGFKAGIARRMMASIFPYMKRGFHPWQYDNSQLLAKPSSFNTTLPKAA